MMNLAPLCVYASVRAWEEVTFASLNLGSGIVPSLLSRYQVFSSPGRHHPLCWLSVRSFTTGSFASSGSWKNCLICSNVSCTSGVLTVWLTSFTNPVRRSSNRRSARKRARSSSLLLWSEEASRVGMVILAVLSPRARSRLSSALANILRSISIAIGSCSLGAVVVSNAAV